MRLLRTFALLLVAVPAAAQVTVSEGVLTLPTYELLPDDPNPPFRETDDSIVYPYTMQDNLGTERRDRDWRVFYLENEYLKVACLPEIGGRIQWVLDKRRNEQMFYNNQVIKPGLIALRGAWISGGIEWNRGPQGHTVTSYSPVNVTGVENPDGSATLVIGEIEQTFRTGWEVRLTLRPGVARLDQEIRIFNPTDLPHPYYFWNNTAFPQRDGTRFLYPMSLASDHFGTTFYRFPEDGGVDMTRLPNYPEPTSLFAYRAVHDFFGAYDSGTDRGIVQTADHHELPGKKAWTWGQGGDGMMNQRNLTDEDGPYIEVQSGPLPTQSDYAWLTPGQTVSWEEQWAPVFGLGEGFEYATPELVVERTGDGFRFLANQRLDGAEIHLDTQAEMRDLTPDAVVAIPWSGGTVEVVVRAEGREILRYRSPLEIPIEEPPTLEEPGEPESAEEIFQRAERADKDLDRAAARTLYERALALTPEHTDAAVGLAVLDLKAGLYGRAAERLDAVTAADPEHGLARFLQGVARLGLGDDEGALDAAYLATKLGGVELPAWRLAGRVRMKQGSPHLAAAAFARGQSALLPVAWLAAGDTAEALRLADEMIARGTVDLIPWAVRLHAGEEAAQSMVALAGEPEFAFTELLVTLAGLGLPEMALDVLDALREHGGFDPGPVLAFHAASWSDSPAGWDQMALTAPLDYAFPSRPESLPVLEAAAERMPGSATPRLLMGHLLAGLGRYDEAIPAWEAATEWDPLFSTAHRALAMTHWKLKERPAAAESRFRAALAARPADQTLARDFARFLLEHDRPAEAIPLLADIPPEARRHDATIELARALNATGRFADTIAMLAETEVSFREGDATVWRLFSRAGIALGEEALASGDPETALAHFEQALTYPENLGVGRSHRPTEARAQWHRAEALRALGRNAEAEEALAACAANHPLDDEQAHYIALCQAPAR